MSSHTTWFDSCTTSTHSQRTINRWSILPSSSEFWLFIHLLLKVIRWFLLYSRSRFLFCSRFDARDARSRSHHSLSISIFHNPCKNNLKEDYVLHRFLHHCDGFFSWWLSIYAGDIGTSTPRSVGHSRLSRWCSYRMKDRNAFQRGNQWCTDGKTLQSNAGTSWAWRSYSRIVGISECPWFIEAIYY